jgi:hypothetical protein
MFKQCDSQNFLNLPVGSLTILLAEHFFVKHINASPDSPIPSSIKKFTLHKFNKTYSRSQDECRTIEPGCWSK